MVYQNINIFLQYSAHIILQYSAHIPLPKSGLARNILWPVNTYPDNFESETFSFRIQKFPRPHVSEFKSNLPVHTKPTRIKIHASAQDSSGNIGNRACVKVAILNTVITVKNGLDLITSPDKKYPDLASFIAY